MFRLTHVLVKTTGVYLMSYLFMKLASRTLPTWCLVQILCLDELAANILLAMVDAAEGGLAGYPYPASSSPLAGYVARW